MHRRLSSLPILLVLLVSTAFLLHGAIPQYANYHQFADTTARWHIPNAWDVLSNLPFALVGVVSLIACANEYRQGHRRWELSDFAYLIFSLSILATSIGSSYYHAAPDQERLFWDRLPIALACASLLVAVRWQSTSIQRAHRAQVGVIHVRALVELFGMLLFAIASVVWWRLTEDLRLYLGLQLLTILLIPLWQYLDMAPVRQRQAYGVAIAAYIVAKVAESCDALILLQTGLVSGHTLKHLLSAAAAALVLWDWMHRKNIPSRAHSHEGIIDISRASSEK